MIDTPEEERREPSFYSMSNRPIDKNEPVIINYRLFDPMCMYIYSLWINYMFNSNLSHNL